MEPSFNAKPMVNIPRTPPRKAPAPQAQLPHPRQANLNAHYTAAFQADFQRLVGKSWAQASKSEKGNFVANKVLAIHHKLHSLAPKNKKSGKNPFTQSDFSLTQEEFDALPHNWFKGFYIMLKNGGYGEAVGMPLTDYELDIFFENGPIIQAFIERGPNPPHKSFLTGTWGGTRKSRSRSRRNRKTRRRQN